MFVIPSIVLQQEILSVYAHFRKICLNRLFSMFVYTTQQSGVDRCGAGLMV
jgi:hypothetical protein